jgi:hypothetical protein
MLIEPHPATCSASSPRKLILGIFWALLGAAVVLALMVLLLPGSVFLALSNYLQIVAALVAAMAFTCAWLRCGKQEALL